MTEIIEKFFEVENIYIMVHFIMKNVLTLVVKAIGFGAEKHNDNSS